MSSPGSLRFPQVSSTPSPPPAGYAIIYIKIDDVLYLQDSDGNEIPLGSASSITQLTGDVTAIGPGSAVATVALVGGQTAAEVAQSVTDTQNATALNVINTLVLRDGSGNFAAGTVTANLTGNVTGNLTGNVTGLVNSVAVEAHAARHLPSGADPLATAAPLANLSATTSNGAGSAESFSKSDHSHAISTGTVSTQVPDQANAAGSSANLARADHIHNIPSGTPVQVGTSNFAGGAASFALSDHVHSHGNQTSGTLHAAATNAVNGFMSAADKVILDAATSTNTPSTLVLRDGSGNFAAGTITASLTGSASNNVLRAGDTMTGAFITSVVALTDAATIATDAALGNTFTVTLGGNRTLGAPTNPVNGQKVVYRIRQDSTGSRTLAFDAVFRFGADISSIALTTTPDKTDYIGVIYHGPDAKWDVIAFSRAF